MAAGAVGVSRLGDVHTVMTAHALEVEGSLEVWTIAATLFRVRNVTATTLWWVQAGRAVMVTTLAECTLFGVETHGKAIAFGCLVHSRNDLAVLEFARHVFLGDGANGDNFRNVIEAKRANRFAAAFEHFCGEGGESFFVELEEKVRLCLFNVVSRYGHVASVAVGVFKLQLRHEAVATSALRLLGFHSVTVDAQVHGFERSLWLELVALGAFHEAWAVANSAGSGACFVKLVVKRNWWERAFQILRLVCCWARQDEHGVCLAVHEAWSFFNADRSLCYWSVAALAGHRTCGSGCALRYNILVTADATSVVGSLYRCIALEPNELSSVAINHGVAACAVVFGAVNWSNSLRRNVCVVLFFAESNVATNRFNGESFHVARATFAVLWSRLFALSGHIVVTANATFVINVLYGLSILVFKSLKLIGHDAIVRIVTGRAVFAFSNDRRSVGIVQEHDFGKLQRTEALHGADFDKVSALLAREFGLGLCHAQRAETTCTN